MRSYETARSLFSFLAFCAWSVVVVGGIVALLGAGSVSQYAGGGAGLIAMVPGLGIALAGLLLVAFVQIGRANVDTAEYTQQMLKIARDQLDVSKQSLKQGDTFQKNYATLNMEAKDTQQNKGYSSKKSKPEKSAEPESKPIPIKQFDKQIQYEGRIIISNDNLFRVDNAVFETMEFAKEHIDLLRDKEDMAAKIAVLSVKPAPEPELVKQRVEPVIEVPKVKIVEQKPEPGPTEYKGKSIEPKGDTYVCNGIPFKTMDAAKNYIDKFATTPMKTLPGVRRS